MSFGLLFGTHTTSKCDQLIWAPNIVPLFEGLLQKLISSSFHIFLGATSIFNFVQWQWNIKFPLRPNSNLDQVQRQYLHQEHDRRRGQAALERQLECWNGQWWFALSPLVKYNQGTHFLAGHTISKGDGHFRKSPVLAHWRHNHNGHDNH